MDAARQKTAIVTGANTGLGFETAKGLAKAGYTVIMACRNLENAAAAIKKIKRKVPDAHLEFIHLDLIDRESIRTFAERFDSLFGHLDLLVNNAGVMGPPYTMTPNGLELQLDANHMGHFYLTSLLMDKLDQDFETRVVNVSSIAAKHEVADIYWDNINFENGEYENGREMFGLKGMTAYSQSKFANLLFTLELKDRCVAAGKNIKVLVAHPGASNTDLKRNMKPHLLFFAPIISRFMNVSQPAQGAEALLMAATKAGVKAGEFYGPTGEDERTGPAGHVPIPEKAQDKVLMEKFWAFSEDHLGITFSV